MAQAEAYKLLVTILVRSCNDSDLYDYTAAAAVTHPMFIFGHPASFCFKV